MEKLVYITMYSGYNPESRKMKVLDSVSRTIQDAVVDVPSLLRQFDGHLDDLFNKYNNGLLFESEVGVFVDELNAAEVKAYNDYIAKQVAAEAEKKKLDEDFAAWRAECAQQVIQKRETTPPAVPPVEQSEK